MTTPIRDVSDTAHWVAVYRIQESQRPDALFQDPLAARLVGENWEEIAGRLHGSRYVYWSVVMRTVVIDSLIRDLVKAGVGTVVNLGAGLDTRPYRLDLPAHLHWVEVDYSHTIQRKEEKLAQEKPRCQLRRIGLDLADLQARQKIFAELAQSPGPILVLTEGLLPYLSEKQVASLAGDLRREQNFRYWVADYYSPEVMRHMRNRKRLKQMQNAPFLFQPAHWFDFFARLGWKTKDIRYLGEAAAKAGRGFPMPWWAEILFFLVPREAKARAQKGLAYVLLERE